MKDLPTIESERKGMFYKHRVMYEKYVIVVL